MKTEDKLKIMADTKKPIVDYLQEQLNIERDALKSYEDLSSPINSNDDPEIKKLRESEAIKIRDRIYQLKRHIAVIKRM